MISSVKNMIDGMGYKKKYYVLYTLCFAIASFCVFIWFLLGRRTLIWHADGWSQHYKALVYYAQYLRSILMSIIRDHELAIPNWDFAFGEGGDVLQILHYYVIGEPLTFFSVFVPTRFMYVYYDAMIIIRLYLAGLVFSGFCFAMGNRNRFAVLSGAMTYVFCYWALYNATMHPYFLTPMIYLPLLLWGIEKTLKNESVKLFWVGVFLAGISNFYFFYILVLLVIIYVAVRLVTLYGNNVKQIVIMLLRIGIVSLLGVGMSAVILLPMIYVFLNNARMGNVNNLQHLFYPLFYYNQLWGMMISKDTAYSLYLGFSAPALLAVLLLFKKRKQHVLLKALFLIGMAVILLPIFGQIFNGLSYMSNRWSFAFAFLMSYIMVVMWPSLIRAKEKERIFLFGGLTVYFILCMIFEYSRTVYVFTTIIMGYLFLFFLGDTASGNVKISLRKRNRIALAIIMASIFSLSFWRYAAAKGAGYVATESIEAKNAGWSDLKENETMVIIDQAEEDNVQDFYRYSGHDLTTNAGMIAGVSSTQFYWSLSNPYLTQYRDEMKLLETGQSFTYTGYDDRAPLLSLASVLYYTSPAYYGTLTPYGYSLIEFHNVKGNDTYLAAEALKEELNVTELSEEQSKRIESKTASYWGIYRNEYALPLSYTYDSYMPLDMWEQLSAVEKQEVMLRSVVTDIQPQTIRTDSGEALSSREISYQVTANDNGVSVQENSFVVTSANSSVTFEFEGLADSETYFEITGLDFKGVSDYELYFGDDTVDPNHLYTRTDWELLSYAAQQKIKKDRLFWTNPEDTTLSLTASSGMSIGINYKTPDFTWYHNKHDFSVDLYYYEEPVTFITMSFQKPGIYTYDEIAIFCQPMGEYAERIEDLRQDILQSVEFGNDIISGSITLNSPKMLCLSIPYSAGWRAYVDGKETELFQANIAYMAIEIDEGAHEVILMYETPFLKVGIMISIGSLVVFLIYLVWERHRRKRYIAIQI